MENELFSFSALVANVEGRLRALGSIVRLLLCEFMGSNPLDSISACGVKALYIQPSYIPLGQSIMNQFALVFSG